ncbi:MAG: NUDIX hydrolase [Caldicoprobacterales bacterium]|jgi:ADP-ribose pyrophosphatase YjhB (NUDIX family)|nr:NUDIX domain-containing protein [Clostridiales bacterium]
MMVFDILMGIDENPAGNKKVYHREAVRAIIIKEGRILMISTKKSDYKLPGGGVTTGESHEGALIREVREETGYTVSKVKEKIGIVTQRRADKYEEDSIFQMVSHYYLCDVNDGQIDQELEDYEAELEFIPKWVSVDSAINCNESILINENTGINDWVYRETTVLHQLKSIVEL